jgi:hypothetical protein
MMEAAHTSETSVDIQLITWQYIPEDSELQETEDILTKFPSDIHNRPIMPNICMNDHDDEYCISFSKQLHSYCSILHNLVRITSSTLTFRFKSNCMLSAVM